MTPGKEGRVQLRLSNRPVGRRQSLDPGGWRWSGLFFLLRCAQLNIFFLAPFG